MHVIITRVLTEMCVLAAMSLLRCVQAAMSPVQLSGIFYDLLIVFGYFSVVFHMNDDKLPPYISDTFIPIVYILLHFWAVLEDSPFIQSTLNI